MGYNLDANGVNALLRHWRDDGCAIFAPVRFTGGGTFSGTDCVRYGEVREVSEIVFDEKSAYSFKEWLLPPTQFLFNFVEDRILESGGAARKAVIFLRSCDLHGLKRLDAIYLRNGVEDYYYKRLRERTSFVLMGCSKAWASCFCVDMGSNRSGDYDLSIDQDGGEFLLDCRKEEWKPLLGTLAGREQEVVPAFVLETPTRVNVPSGLSSAVAGSEMWNEYDSRCINCGRCNFVCPTCTCFTMQDIFHADNHRSGERRRVQASCMVDGFTDVAGGGSYRKKNGQRMRFKTLHKVLDFKQRFGFQMCVGCGRCDDICPEYISFSHIINKLERAVEEVNHAG